MGSLCDAVLREQALNATVHSFMYFYYFLTSRGYRPSWNLLLTLGQIIQVRYLSLRLALRGSAGSIWRLLCV